MQSAGGNEVAADWRYERKLETFLFDYDLNERPALVLRAYPVNADVEVDVADSSIKVALAQGNPDGAGSSWDGLQGSASGLRGSVDGIACVSRDRPPVWASELHTDGHLIAGIWDFDRPAGSGQSLLITWHYVEFFADFGRLAANLAIIVDHKSDDWLITATLLRADCVHYGSKANRHSNQLSPPLHRRNLEFRIRRCLGAEGLRRGAALMGKDFQRAYGERS